MTTRRFDRLVLGVIGCAVALTAAATIIGPSSGVTASPRVSFDLAHAEAAHLNEGARNVAPRDTEVAALEQGPSFHDLNDVRSLAEGFQEMGYHFDKVRDHGERVPRVFLVRLPDDLHAVPEVSLKKTVFFQTMLPLVLKENERILADRRRLHRLRVETGLGRTLAPQDRLWLAVLAERYKVKDENLDELLKRVDVVPPSLAMAQAAEESGWGTSRFAQRGNALFGQWTSGDDDGLIPRERGEGKNHKIKAFDTLAQSVSAYMRNLNTHRAYRSLRTKRAQMRRAGAPLDGRALSATLSKYSERGKKYIESVRTIIDVNGLSALDDARLAEDAGGDQSA